jgi:hypothetical protein
LPTWGEIQEFARSKYTLSADEDSRFEIVWVYKSDRRQQIWVSRFQSMDRDWIEFRTFVCPVGDLKPEVALAKNPGYTIGSLGVDEYGNYVMTHGALLATLDPEEFELPLQMLASVADDLEKEHAGADQF